MPDQSNLINQHLSQHIPCFFAVMVTGMFFDRYRIACIIQYHLITLFGKNSIWNGGEDGLTERFTGWTDIPLSNTGSMEAVRAGKVIASYKDDIDVCFTSHLLRSKDTAQIIANTMKLQRRPQLNILEDYRLAQGFVKADVEDGFYGHSKEDVILWRRSWNVVPPLLNTEDPRRVGEVQRYRRICGGEDNIPRGESLQMVANNRIKPFVTSVLTPCLHTLWKEKRVSHDHVTGMIVGHANSLRALIGVLCDVENDERKIESLEELRIPTCQPLVLKFQFTNDGLIRVCSLPEAISNSIPIAPLVKCVGLITEQEEEIISGLESRSFNRTLIL